MLQAGRSFIVRESEVAAARGIKAKGSSSGGEGEEAVEKHALRRRGCRGGMGSRPGGALN